MTHLSRLRQLLRLSFLTILFAGSAATVADDFDDARDALIQQAYANNRELRIATLEIERALSRLRWSGRLENPEFELSRSGDGFGNNDRESVYEAAFTQRFPVTAKLRHEKTLRRYQVILAEAEIAEERRQLAGQIDLALVDLIAIRQQITVGRELVKLNREILDFLGKQADEGLVSSLDVMQARLSGRTIEQRIKALEASETQARLAVQKLVGIDPETPVRAPRRLHLPKQRPAIQISFADVLRRRPDYALALTKTDEATAAVTLEKAKRWQDISVRLFVEQEETIDDPSGRDGNTFTGFGISIPFPLRDRNQDGIEQARIDQMAADEAVNAARFRIRSECEKAFQKRRNAWELADEASGDILVLAETNLAEFRQSYEQGQSSLTQVQRAQEQALELRNASIEFLTDYHRAAAAVRLAIGSYPGLSTSSKNPIP